MLDRMVTEAPRLTTDRVDLSPLASAMPRTWVRTQVRGHPQWITTVLTATGGTVVIVRHLPSTP